MWKWHEDTVRSPTGYYPNGVPKPQKILKLKTMVLDKLSVLSKHDTHLLARQGSQTIQTCSPPLQSPPLGRRLPDRDRMAGIGGQPGLPCTRRQDAAGPTEPWLSVTLGRLQTL